jgi:histidinol phosphatase-like enzyme (inositol monophosphatase family)
VLGEELGGSALGTRPSGLGGSRCWLIDPIDGTRSFIAGVPLWGTLVALAEGETVIAGAINCAAASELVVAAVGAGSWWNGSRCAVSSIDRLDQATVLTTDDRFLDRPDRRARWAYLAERARTTRTWGDCYGYLLVATGRAEVMVDDRMRPWDAAPLLPIVTEAGGALTDWRGRATAFGGDTIATNGALAALVRSVLGDEPPPCHAERRAAI